MKKDKVENQITFNRKTEREDLIKNLIKKGYRKPLVPYIANMPETQKLYTAEQKVTDSLIKAAEELKKLYSEREINYNNLWKEAIPEEIYQLLDSVESDAAIIAAVTFLEKKGLL